MVSASHGLNSNENQVDLGSLRALKDKVGPEPFFIEFGAAANPTIGTPLPLSLEKLTLLAEPKLHSISPAFAGASPGRRRLGWPTSTATATVGGDEDHVSVGGTGDERSETDELVARRRQISDSENRGRHVLHQQLKNSSSKGRAIP